MATDELLDAATTALEVRVELNDLLEQASKKPDFGGVDPLRAFLATDRVDQGREAVSLLREETGR